MEDNIAGIPIEDLKPLAIKYEGNDSFESLQKIAVKISVARAARLSYMTFDGDINYEKDIKLHDTLLESHHMSPFEHCARAMSDEEYLSFIKGKIDIEEYHLNNEDGFPNHAYPEGISVNNPASGWCNNFHGWIPYRHMVCQG